LPMNGHSDGVWVGVDLTPGQYKAMNLINKIPF